MVTLITYDVVDNAIRARLHKMLKEYGLNTQKWVFECDIDPHERKRLMERCRAIIDLEKDSVRVYRICNGCYAKAAISGVGMSLTQFNFTVV